MTIDQSNRARPTYDRRTILKGTAAGAAAVAFGALSANAASASKPAGSRQGLGSPKGGYGRPVPTVDQATGLALLALPEGFSYRSYGWTGQIMSDGQPTPTDHDGMAVVAKRGREIALVRNHELSSGESTRAVVDGGAGNYNENEYGGTTNLVFDTVSGTFVRDWASLGGTIRNCAGGPTPWGSWISCEETFHDWGSRSDHFNHGYIFDVPAWGTSDGEPIRAAGRFSHEAVAVDPKTGIVYETEDEGESGFYAYMNPAGPNGIADGGELYAMVVDGTPKKDLRGHFEDGTTFAVTWEKVEDPEGKEGAAFDSAPNAAIIARGEGAWYDAGMIYFISTSGGAAGLGQLWMFDPKRQTLTMVFESPNSEVLDGPDNVCVSPRGGILMCEDGNHDPQRLIGLSSRGEVFEFAQNRIILGEGDLETIDAVYPGTKDNFWDDSVGNYTDVEWAGATFHGDWLFVNIQSPGVTFAITGPWHQGAL